MLLNHSLEMHFDIGELDFQASREGLSYIPQTIDAIKRKLEAVNAQLAIHIANEANAITNSWERALYLVGKSNDSLWSAAVVKYIVDTKNPFFDQNISGRGYIRAKDFVLRTADLVQRYNIHVRGFSKHHYYDTTSNLSSTTVKEKALKADGTQGYESAWEFGVSSQARFIINDTNVGCVERAKYHVKNDKTVRETRWYYVLEPAVKGQPMNTKAFFRALCNPPQAQIMLASSLDEKPRKDSTGAGIAKNVTIMRLEERGSGGYYRSQDYVWRECGKADSFDDKATYYYIPLSGFNIDCKRINDHFSSKSLMEALSESGIKGLNNITVYGVRKGDIEAIKLKSNWVELDTKIADTIVKLTAAEIKSIAMGCVDKNTYLRYNERIVKAIGNQTSPYVVAANNVKNADKASCHRHSVDRLFKAYDYVIDLDTIANAIVEEHRLIHARYPLLNNISGYAEDADVAEYINLIDEKKGI
jgi:hypothetical protein